MGDSLSSGDWGQVACGAHLRNAAQQSQPVTLLPDERDFARGELLPGRQALAKGAAPERACELNIAPFLDLSSSRSEILLWDRTQGSQSHVKSLSGLADLSCAGHCAKPSGSVFKTKPVSAPSQECVTAQSC